MNKRIAILSLPLLLGWLFAAVSSASAATSSCDPATRPAAVTRVVSQFHPGISATVTTTHTQSACSEFTSTWVVTGGWVREAQRFGRDVPAWAHPCQVFARHQGRLSTHWTRWALAPRATAHLGC